MHKRGRDQETFVLSAQTDQGEGSQRLPCVKRIGNYLTSHVLGVGGMGAVYQARHLGTNQLVAVKVIGPHLLHNRSAERRFETEASAISRIEHRNVIRLLDFGHLADGTLYYAMEHLDGVVLTDLLKRRGKMTPEQAVPFIQQICAGLQAAHDAGVVHRDLKPDNVFVASEDPLHLKVFDFGVAKLLDQERLTATGLMVGTPLYFAPEQALGHSDDVSPQTDLYSLGVMAYSMLSGGFPFYDKATAQMVLHHVSKSPPSLKRREPGIPDTVAHVVHWCLEKKPAHRPLSAMALAIAYSAAVDSTTKTKARQQKTRVFASRFDSQRATVDLAPSKRLVDEHTTRRRKIPPASEQDERKTVPARRTPKQAHEEDDHSTVLFEPHSINTIDLVRVPLTPGVDPPLLPIMQPRRQRRSDTLYVLFAAGLFALSVILALIVLLV